MSDSLHEIIDKRGVRFEFVSYKRRITDEDENNLCMVILNWLKQRDLVISVNRDDDMELVKFRKLPRYGPQ